MLVACGDDDSDFATRPSEGSSSSVCEDCDESSSSSVTPQSSDSETSVSSSSSAKSSSSSSAKSSSSEKSSSSTKSSSSGAKSSSSSVTPCDVNTEKNCFMDSRDGQTYKTVTIGTQTWMAENLNYETANSYCYDDSASNCTKYGRLYEWEVATTACPEGWHLPTKAEFETLFTAVGGESIAGQKLKSTTGWTAYSGITNEDAFAFSALPAGNRGDDGECYTEGYYAFFWSSTELSSYNAYNMYLYYSINDAYLNYNYKDSGFSVRCLKD